MLLMAALSEISDRRTSDVDLICCASAWSTMWVIDFRLVTDPVRIR